MSSADAIRTYVIHLRTQQRISQDSVATAAGLTRRGYIMWETGDIKDIKLPVLLKVLEAVGGWVAHLRNLDNASEEDANALAAAWLKLSPPERENLRTLFDSEDGRIHLIQSVLDLAEDPELKGRLQGYMLALQELKGK